MTPMNPEEETAEIKAVVDDDSKCQFFYKRKKGFVD